MSKKSNAELGIDAVVEWVPAMVDHLTESIAKSGGLPGMKQVSGQQMINLYRAASPEEKVKFWQQMTPEERQSVESLYAIEGPEVVRP